MFEKTLPTVDGQIKIRVPSMLNELTVGQMIAMQDLFAVEHNDIDVVSVLSGIPKVELLNIRNLESLAVFNETILNLLSQLELFREVHADLIPEQVTFKIPVNAEKQAGKKFLRFRRTEVTHRPVTVKVLQNLKVEPVGAFMNARDIISEEINKHIKVHGEDWEGPFQPGLKAACRVLGHYFYCRVYGEPYDSVKAEAFSEIVKTLPITQALPIAGFFFVNYKTLSAPKVSFWQRVSQYSRKKRAFRNLKNLAS